MWGVTVNPAVLRQCRNFTIRESVAHHEYAVQKAFAVTEQQDKNGEPLKVPLNSTLSLKAGECFLTGFELLEYLAEREEDDFVNQIVMYPRNPNAKENDSWI